MANPAASRTTRVHLVIDVFESPRQRTKVPAGSTCEYGPQGGLARLQRMAAATDVDMGAIEAELRALLASPGMACFGPDGARVLPTGVQAARRAAAARAAAAAAASAYPEDAQQHQHQGGEQEADENEALVQHLLAGLLQQRNDAHVPAAAAGGARAQE